MALSLAAPAGATPPNVNLIERGDFEVPIDTGLARLYPAGSHIGPWTVSGATVGVGLPFAGIVEGIHGRNLEFLSLKDPTGSISVPMGTVCQRVALDPAASYRLRFYSASVTADATLIVTWQGQTVGTFDMTGSIGDTNWQLQQISLGRAGATSGEVCFTGEGLGFPLVDAVTLHATTA
jgi:hypothetical protein